MWHTLQCCLLALLLWQRTWPTSCSDDFETDHARTILRISKSADIRNLLETSVNPCDNFYGYACGKWDKVNPASAEPKTDIFHVLSKAYDRKVAQLLSRPKVSSDSEMERKVKYFYESCLNKDEVRHNYKQKLMNVMEEFGGMPALKGDQWEEDKFDWLDVVARILRKYGKQIILGVDISADLTNNQVNRLYVGQLDDLITTSAPEYYTQLFIARPIELQQVLGMSEGQSYVVGGEMVSFERSLAEGISEPREGLGMEDKTRLRLLEEMTETYKPMLNFTRFAEVWLGYEYRLPVYEYVETYLINLRKLLLNTPTPTVANYIMWQLLQDFRLEAEQTAAKQQMKCVKATKRYFVKFLDNLVYRHLVLRHRSAIEEVRFVWGQLKQTFEQRLLSNAADWLTEKTRDKALEKLSAMSLEINSYEWEDFDKQYSELTVGTEHYFENVINVLELRGRNYRLKLHEQPKLENGDTLNFTPAYAPEYNKVLIPVAFLQPRYLWDDVYPAALKYATVGYIVGHEMAHGYDDVNRKYDAKGNLNNWWDRNSTQAFALRKECLRRQFSDYTYAGRTLLESKAQGENIADNVGIRLAFAAYESWLQQNQYDSVVLQLESLPHLAYTPRQLFFIGLAQMWCTDVHATWRIVLAKTDIHAPGEIRIQAMVSNFDQFALEFQCPLGSKMNPRERCVVY